MVKRVALLCFFLFVSPAKADEAMTQAFQDWAIEEGMEPAALVAFDANGKLVASTSILSDVNTPMPIASISKTIAAQCTLHSVHLGLLSLDDPVSKFLGWDAQQGAVTIAQLLTHTSGYGPDATQRHAFGRLLRDENRVAAAVDDIATRPLEFETGTHNYNNENYLVLEAVLAERLAFDPLDWCKREVPALATLKTLGRSETLKAIGFAGGLEISTYELAVLFRDLERHPDWPTAVLDPRNSYGPGLVIQSVEGGENLFHTGALCRLFGPNLGAFAARLANGASVAMIYSGCADEKDLRFLNELTLDHLSRP